MASQTSPITQAQPYVEAVYDDAFQLVEGNDPRDAGAIVSSVVRLAGMMSTNLRLGSLRSVSGWGMGQSFHCQCSRGRNALTMKEDVWSWEDVCEDLALPAATLLQSDTPLFLSRQALTEYLTDSRFVEWFAYRQAATSTWIQHNKRQVIERDNIKKVCTVAFQADLIVNNQQFPRSRLRFHFDNGRLWQWVNAKGDFLIIFSTKNNASHQLVQCVQLGEAFMLT